MAHPPNLKKYNTKTSEKYVGNLPNTVRKYFFCNSHCISKTFNSVLTGSK